MRSLRRTHTLLPLALLSTLPVGVLGGDLLSTTGYSSCLDNPTVQVQKLNVTYDKNTRVLSFDVAGSSTEVQNVTANLIVSAYGRQVYNKSINPCDTGMPEMCPVPAASFSSFGHQTIPAEYANQIPALAFSVPDLDGDVQMELKNSDGQNVACIRSSVGNGHSFNMPAVSYAAVGIAAGALLLSGISALAAGAHPGASTPSPTFGEVIGWFQGMAMNGMMSVKYPQVYQSFTTNFAFSTGLVPWGALQTSIDSFRAKTGGNLTQDSYEYLSSNATLMYGDSSNSTSSNVRRRALDTALLWLRDGTEINVNGTSADVGGTAGDAPSSLSASSREQHFVYGIAAYAEQLRVPQANTFMTVLLIWAVLVGVIIVLILLLKVILEAWSMFGNIPRSMESWRKRYWWRLAKVLTNLILMLYGVWTMYCIYQWTDGDSWAAKLLAGLTLGGFTAVLAFFIWRIHIKAHEYKRLDGDAGKLYEDKETWVKYNLFYENFKKQYWWLFVPVILYTFARGCVIAAANGHGMAQTIGQLVVEALMLAVLLWSRPYQRRSGIWINTFIQVVRVLSVCCMLVFVEELGISQTTKTVTGIVLIVVQCVLTATLAILIAVNALIGLIRVNPHRKQRKANEKKLLAADLDDLTPLDARNSLLMEPMAQRHRAGSSTSTSNSMYKAPTTTSSPFGAFAASSARYGPVPARDQSPSVLGGGNGGGSERGFTRPSRFSRREEDGDYLVSSAASMGRRGDDGSRSGSRSPVGSREPTLPDVYGHGRAY